MTALRLSGLFAAVFAIAYTIAFEGHYELFSYHPKLRAFGWGQDAVRDGPVMHWYGAIATGALAGLAALACAWPLRHRMLPPLWIGWAVPLGCVAAWGWLLRGFFLR
jgi:hypothetical protein